MDDKRGMIDVLKLKYHLSEEQVQEAIDAVGSDENAIETYLKQAYLGDAGAGSSTGGVAVNPNPKANKNIKDEIAKASREDIDAQKRQVGNEITDGEDG